MSTARLVACGSSGWRCVSSPSYDPTRMFAEQLLSLALAPQRRLSSAGIHVCEGVYAETISPPAFPRQQRGVALIGSRGGRIFLLCGLLLEMFLRPIRA